MDKKTIELLEKERKKQTDELIRELIENNDLEKARKNLEWIQLSDQLKNSFPSSSLHKWFWPVVIGAICLFIIGIAWTKRIETTQISFEVTTSNVSLKLSDEWRLNTAFIAEMIFINNLDNVISRQLGIEFQRDIEKEDPATLKIVGSNSKLKNLIIKRDAIVYLTLNKSQLILEAKSKPLEGIFEVNKAEIVLTRVIDGEDSITTINPDLEDFETISFISSNTPAQPFKIELITDFSWEIRDLRTYKLSFIEEYPPGSGNFESTIKSGKVRLLETGVIEDLREDDSFLLKGVETRRLELRNTDTGIKVYFEGKVSSIKAGPPGYEKDLAPTYLEYIYHQKKLAFFWSAIVFLWGLLWSLKNTIFGK